MASSPNHLLLAGGGLANCLIALRVRAAHPDARITIVEAGPALCGNHTWSFHAGDLSPDQHEVLAPVVQHRWPAQEVRFPKYRRRLDAAYLSITSDALRDHMHEASVEIHTDTRAMLIGPDFIDTDRGRIEGSAVIDGRGPSSSEGLVLGFQKFFGREVRTAAPHGVDVPVIMDAEVSQADGYRFIYLLPFDETTLLIEDTRYSDGAELDDSQLSAAIDDYAAANGWDIAQTLREERGVLPILLAGDFDAFWPVDDPVARSGLRAALFHPTTGYSLPQALTLADAISSRWPMNGAELAALTRDHARRFFESTGFFRMLNRLLFRAGESEKRYIVMQRFYGLSGSLIEHFYAADLRWRDKARLVVGKPPVPFFRSFTFIDEEAFLEKEGDGARD
ncbi:lycopene beta-cyclase CrtY [Halomonas denitrificans]|nr:lycopene beta-cyclase CrtY [Halomonas denitrificans]